MSDHDIFLKPSNRLKNKLNDSDLQESQTDTLCQLQDLLKMFSQIISNQETILHQIELCNLAFLELEQKTDQLKDLREANEKVMKIVELLLASKKQNKRSRFEE